MLRNGVLMALDQWNQQGGVARQQLEAVDYDTDCSYESAQQAVQQAVAAKHHLLIGPLCSQAAVTAAIVAESHQALLLAPTATHPLVTVSSAGQTRPTIFRASLAYAQQGQAMATFAYQELAAHRAAVLVNLGDDYSIALTEAFAQQFTAAGGEVKQYPYPLDSADFKPILAQIAQARITVLYLPVPAPVVNQMAARWREWALPNPPTLLGSDSWDSPELDRAVTEGSYFTTHFFVSDDAPEVQAWVEAYKAKFAIEPTTLAALGYEATHILTTAIQEAGTGEVDAVTNMLEQSSFAGIGGPLTFDIQHNPHKPMPVIQVKEGQLRLVTSIFP
jgi:branched-chain amino acid transport system substrate-binding protein